MKHASTPILRTLALSLLIVVTLAGTTNMFSASTAYADPPPAAPVEPKPAIPPPKEEPKSDADKKSPDAPAPGPKDPALSALGNQTVGDILPGAGGDVILALSKVLAIVLSMISHLLWPLLMFAGGLMKSDFLYTGAVDLKLSEMWIQVRNLVNIAYVLLLLAVALYNVLGLGEVVSMLELKKALPKIILGLVLVNFSYAGVKVVLDVVNVGTTFAFSIGRTDARLTQETAAQVKAAQGPICDTLGIAKLAEGLGKEASDADAKELKKKRDAEIAGLKTADDKENRRKYYEIQDKKNPAGNENAMCTVKDGKFVINEKVNRYLNSWNVDSSLMIMAIKFMNIQDLPKVSKAATGGLTSLTINMLFSVVMFLMYAVSFIVLIIVLFARAAILWMIIIFSPVLVFNATFPIPGVGGKTDTIIKTLIAPMLIGFVLSIGFILLSTMQNINYNDAGNIISNAPTSSIDTFQDLLIAIGSIVFLWKGIEFATSDTISAKLTDGVLSGAKEAGTWLASAPFKYAPLFQVATPHAGHAGLQDAGKIGVGLDQAKYAVEHMFDRQKAEREEQTRKLFGLGEISLKLEDVRTLDNLTGVLRKKYHGDIPSMLKDHDEAIKAFDNIKSHEPTIAASPEFKKAQAEVVKNKDGSNEADAKLRVEEFLSKHRPRWKDDDDTPATPTTPAAAKAQAQAVNTDADGVKAIPALKNGTIGADAKATAAAMKKYSDAFEGSTADMAARAKEIVDHLKGVGVTIKANRDKIMDDPSFLNELKKIMKPADADELVKEIKKISP